MESEANAYVYSIVAHRKTEPEDAAFDYEESVLHLCKKYRLELQKQANSVQDTEANLARASKHEAQESEQEAILTKNELILAQGEMRMHRVRSSEVHAHLIDKSRQESAEFRTAAYTVESEVAGFKRRGILTQAWGLPPPAAICPGERPELLHRAGIHSADERGNDSREVARR